MDKKRFESVHAKTRMGYEFVLVCTVSVDQGSLLRYLKKD